MKIKKKVLLVINLFFFLNLISFKSMGQKNELPIIIENKDLIIHLDSVIKTTISSKILNSGCEHSIFFIEFYLNKRNKINNVKCSFGANDDLYIPIKEALCQSQVFWKINDRYKKRLKNKVFLIPVIYSLGCIGNEQKRPVDNTFRDVFSLQNFELPPNLSWESRYINAYKFQEIYLLHPLFITGAVE